MWCRLESKFLWQHTFAFFYRNSLFLHRTANDHRNCATFCGSLNLFFKSACFSGIFCYQISAVILTQHGSIQFFRKRALHGNQIFALESQHATGFDHILNGKDSCKHSFLITRNFCISRKFLTARRKQNISRYMFQIIYCCLCIFYINCIFVNASFTKDSHIRNCCVFTGLTDIYCHFCRIWMCCIQNQFRSFCCKKLLHLFFVKTFCTNR